MRWIVIVLLMLNGIYFLWHQYLSPAQPVATETAGAPSAANVADLVMLSESQAPNSASSAEDSSAGDKVSEVSTIAAAAVCWMVGPFSEQVTQKQVLDRMGALDIAADLVSVNVPEEPDYWVHIAPMQSRKEAIKMLRRLQARKIDSFLIGEGELENGISLGLFSQRDRAQKVYDKRLSQGFEVQIKEVDRSIEQTWAVFQSAAGFDFTEQVWNGIKAGNKGLERRKNYCDKIASLGNLE